MDTEHAVSWPIALHLPGRQRRAVKLRDELRRCGIELNGRRPHDVRVCDARLYDRVSSPYDPAVRAAYVDGLWETDRLDEVTCRVLRQLPHESAATKLALALAALAHGLHNPQSLSRAQRGVQHYQMGEPLFAAMLDRRMVYSCAYFRNDADLDAAQEAKLDLVCRKLGLEPGMRLLDVGCGWGGLARFAAERYGVSVVGITLASDQARVARRVCAGLPVEIRLDSYHRMKDWPERFDAVASLGMFEHVGPRNYAAYFRIIRQLLEPQGLFLLQVIGNSQTASSFDAWMNGNVFPNAHLPSMRQITAVTEGGWIIEDWQNFGADYDRTLMWWWSNFERAWPELRALYDQRFYRLWKCYLLTCAGAFRARYTQLWQIVLSPAGVTGGYRSLR